MQSAAMPPRSTNFRQLKLDFVLWPCRRLGHDFFHYAEPPQALGFTHPIRVRFVLTNRFADDFALRFGQASRGAAEAVDRFFVQRESHLNCHSYGHTTIPSGGAL
jgi:hypothetical protein